MPFNNISRMNLNVKLDGEEEQALQYVNRFAINIPSGAAAINLNIVNPALGNQSYILNPMNPVGQNIVYQPPMALQSYIALPTEPEGNIIHSLPVGVSVPVGLPVPTGLLQNNFVNTSIIIGDEDCNSSGVLKPPSNNLNPENEIKINYIEKPVENLTCNKTNGIEVQSIGVNCSPLMSADISLKKPCPLEMSIKAANIDIEFEKCEPEVPILLNNCQAVVEKPPVLMGTMPLATQLKESILKVPLEVPPNLGPGNVEVSNADCKKMKTEITWENNNKQGLVDNGFQESLICEVEEEDEDDEEEVEEEEEEEEDEGEDVEEEEEEDEEEEEESEGEKESHNTNCTSVNSDEDSGSSEESDSLPLSVALKLNKLPNPRSNKSALGKNKRGRIDNSQIDDSLETRKKKSHKKKQTGEEEYEEEEADDEEKSENWMKTDDDGLNLKRIKNEFNYKCFYEPNSAKSTTSLVLKLDGEQSKFVRVRSCCSKRECGKKISVQDQKAAHRNFQELESAAKRDAYLVNCIEHIQKSKFAENAKEKSEEKLLEKAKIQLEIESESNGNQKLSDEIQKAINESLKDCVANEEERKREAGGEGEKEEGNEKKNTWNFYIVIDRCRKKVCLQFLLKLFQIPKSRIKNLQKKILTGSPLATEECARGSQKPLDVWELAKSHLEGFECLECGNCSATPRHRFLTERRTREDLFDSFKEFYINKIGKAPNVKYASYKRFLDKKTSISFSVNNDGTCAECEELKKDKKRKQNKGKKGRECKKQWTVKSDSEENSSDDEPLLKRKKLKLTIPLKSVGGKSQQKRTNKKLPAENKSKGKGKQSGSRGRDVWSLMLLHLETMPYKECKTCVCKKKHRFLDTSFTTQGLFEDYRKYFLKETNSELGLGFTMYEKYFNRNCNYTICKLDENAATCPRCTLDGTKT